MPTLPNLIPLADAYRFTQALIGEHGATLGKLSKQKLPVVTGFIIPVNTFLNAFAHRWTQIEYYLNQLDSDQPESIHQTSQLLQKLVGQEILSDQLVHELVASYQSLDHRHFAQIQLSRCSSIVPYHAFISPPFQGETNLIEMIKLGWQSFFTPAHLLSYLKHQAAPATLAHALVIQQSPVALCSGFAYTHAHHSTKKSFAVIEAVWGETEADDDLNNSADRVEFQRFQHQITASLIQPQFTQKVKLSGLTEKKEVPFAFRYKAKLTQAQTRTLAQLVTTIHRLFFFPRKIHWLLSEDKIWIDDCQPDEFVSEAPLSASSHPSQHKVLIKGIGVRKGSVSGQIRHLKQITAAKSLTPQDIVVLPTWRPQFLPYLRQSGGVIIDSYISPQDITQLDIPVLAGTHHATQLLQDRQTVLLDTTAGTVVSTTELPKASQQTHQLSASHQLGVFLSTGQPEHLSAEMYKKVQGIGLLRAEYIYTKIGVHPQRLIQQHKQEVLIQALTQGLIAACSLDRQKPVVYRLCDFDSQEFRQLQSGSEYEPNEKNPLAGYRGAYRYLTRIDEFNLELAAIARTLQAGYTNLNVMFPFVRSIDEYILLTHHLAEYGLPQSSSLRYWLMVDTPAVAMNIDYFLKAGVSGLCVGARDLLMLLTGSTLQHDSHFAGVYLKDPAFFELLKKVSRAAFQAEKPILFCEHSIISRELLEFLADQRFTGVSVSKQSLPFVLENIQSH